MKHNFKKLMSLLLMLAVILTAAPVQPAWADGDAQAAQARSDFTLKLSGVKKCTINDTNYGEDFNAVPVKLNDKIILESNVSADSKTSWKFEKKFKQSGATQPAINWNEVNEGEDGTVPKNVKQVLTNKINFTIDSAVFGDAIEPITIEAEEFDAKIVVIKKSEDNKPESEDYNKYEASISPSENIFRAKAKKTFNLSDKMALYYKGSANSGASIKFTEIEWTSNPTVPTDSCATITTDGILTPIKDGNLTLHVKANYNGGGSSNIPNDIELNGTVTIQVDLPKKDLIIMKNQEIGAEKLLSTPRVVGDIVEINYDKLNGLDSSKKFFAWHGLGDSQEIDVVNKNGMSQNIKVKNLEPYQKSFYIVMPDKEVKFAPSFEDLNAGKTITNIKNADVKLISRLGKTLKTPRVINQNDKLLENDIIEVTVTKDATKFSAWEYKGLVLNTSSAEDKTAQFKVKGTEDIEIEAVYHPYASSEDKTISGTKGEQLDNTILIALENMYFNKITKGQDLISWFVKPVTGLSYTSNTIIEEANKKTELEIKVSGVPTVTSSDDILIKIPAEFLSSNTEQNIPNPKLKYNITEKPVSHQPQPTPDNNSGSGSNSGSQGGSGSNSGSGSGSKVEKITDKKKEQKPQQPKVEKKEQDKKVEEKKPQMPEKSKEQMNDKPVIKVGDVEIQKVFEDVKQEDWFAASVAFVKEMNLMNGTKEMQFSPQEKTTRAMLVTILHRLAGTPMAEEKASFNDVKGDEYFAQAISWASKSGIVKGYETGSFGTNDNITREQLAVILYNYAVNAKKEIANTADIKKFDDTDSISSYAVEAMNWAISTGIVKGKGNLLDPKANATRAEVATMMMRFAEFLK